jgi:hypothetical protein
MDWLESGVFCAVCADGCAQNIDAATETVFCVVSA